MTDKEKQQIKALRESGESYAQISKMMDLPINSIKTYCRRNNLTSIDVEREDKTSTCLECGKPIEQNPGRKKKKFCSDKCRMLWWNSHSEEVNRKANYSCTCAFCGKRTEENDWYGKDMVLTEEQAKQLADFVSDNQPYNARDVECLVARALLHGNKVVINADW